MQARVPPRVPRALVQTITEQVMEWHQENCATSLRVPHDPDFSAEYSCTQGEFRGSIQQGFTLAEAFRSLRRRLMPRRARVVQAVRSQSGSERIVFPDSIINSVCGGYAPCATWCDRGDETQSAPQQREQDKTSHIEGTLTENRTSHALDKARSFTRGSPCPQLPLKDFVFEHSQKEKKTESRAAKVAS